VACSGHDAPHADELGGRLHISLNLQAQLDGLANPVHELVEDRACVWQPGNSGTLAAWQPSSSRSTMTLKPRLRVFRMGMVWQGTNRGATPPNEFSERRPGSGRVPPWIGSQTSEPSR
jgi:hypothetical protein